MIMVAYDTIGRVQYRQACSPLIQLFFGFASDIDQTNINRDIRDGDWLSSRHYHKGGEEGRVCQIEMDIIRIGEGGVDSQLPSLISLFIFV